jgi:hypothetical protein
MSAVCPWFVMKTANSQAESFNKPMMKTANSQAESFNKPMMKTIKTVMWKGRVGNKNCANF